jgi:DNA-binding MarR family transcriptional regulator
VTDRWLTADEQRAWRAYLRVGTMLTARLNRQLQADCGLSLPEYEVLVQLSEAPGGMLRPFQLVLALDWEQSRLSHLLTRMSRRGFVVRQDCAADRRGADVVLTAAGRAAIESAAPGHVAAVRRLVFDQMDSEQAAAFGRVFEASWLDWRTLAGSDRIVCDVLRLVGFVGVVIVG